VLDAPRPPDSPAPGSTIPAPARGDDLAIVLDGGGARAAYQVGLLKWLGRNYPAQRLPIITGVSAGAINAAFLAAHPGPLGTATEELVGLWSALTIDRVFRVDMGSLAGNLGYWGLRLVSGGRVLRPPVRGLVDTAPLRRTLERAFRPAADGALTGIARNLERGAITGLAIVTSSYTTGRTVAWVQGRDVSDWERPYRQSRQTRLTLEHILASGALPLLFPAVALDGAWYGDGGIRLITPLSPAVHLGANRILAFSTRYGRTVQEADDPQVSGYPQPAQIAGQLLRAIFLDDHDRDALTLTRINRLLSGLPRDQWRGLRLIDLAFIRPSRDLGRLAREYEPRLPFAFRHLVRSLGSRQTNSPDLLSLLMFDGDYLRTLIEIGEADAETHRDEIAALLEGG
jgi:NTE family protein